MYVLLCFFFFFKQKTAYEMRISDWMSDVCSSDLEDRLERADAATRHAGATGCLSATPSRPGLCSLAVLYVGLHLLDDRNCQMLDDPVADQWADMRAEDRKSTRLNSSH